MKHTTHLLDWEAITISMVSTPIPMMLMTACPASVLARLKMHKDWRLGPLLQDTNSTGHHHYKHLQDFPHLALRKLPESNLLISTHPLTPTLFPLLLSSEWIHQIRKQMAHCPRTSFYCFLFLQQVF